MSYRGTPYTLLHSIGSLNLTHPNRQLMDPLQKSPTLCREDRNTIRGPSSQDMRTDACRLTQRLTVIFAQI